MYWKVLEVWLEGLIRLFRHMDDFGFIIFIILIILFI